MKKTLAMADNCIDVYYKMDRYYLTGNSIDFAFNYKDLGGDVTEMTILGNDVFAFALKEQMALRGIPLRILKEVDKPTAIATMDIIDGDKKHLKFEGNAMNDIELNDDDITFIRQFDIVYAERWAKIGRYIQKARHDSQIWVFDFSKRLNEPANESILPYLDYAFFSYDKDDDYIREFMKSTAQKGTRCVVAMLGEHGSLAFDRNHFYIQPAELVQIVNTVGAGDSYIAAFTYGLSLGEDISSCLRRGKERATQIIQQFNPYI
jgi:fructoselysine 6-kinase